MSSLLKGSVCYSSPSILVLVLVLFIPARSYRRQTTAQRLASEARHTDMANTSAPALLTSGHVYQIQQADVGLPSSDRGATIRPLTWSTPSVSRHQPGDRVTSSSPSPNEKPIAQSIEFTKYDLLSPSLIEEHQAKAKKTAWKPTLFRLSPLIGLFVSLTLRVYRTWLFRGRTR